MYIIWHFLHVNKWFLAPSTLLHFNFFQRSYIRSVGSVAHKVLIYLLIFLYVIYFLIFFICRILHTNITSCLSSLRIKKAVEIWDFFLHEQTMVNIFWEFTKFRWNLSLYQFGCRDHSGWHWIHSVYAYQIVVWYDLPKVHFLIQVIYLY